MKEQITFYSASAGSGKTFTLSRDYLLLLFKGYGSQVFREILAVTFTNKAVIEMKERVLGYLNSFGSDTLDAGSREIRNYIQEELDLDKEEFKLRAASIYNNLLHNYSSFDIVTIDAFNHRLLQTFARDLDLPEGFEVELDTQIFFQKAVKNLLARAGSDPVLTKILVEFALGKIDEGRSWNIEYDLLDICNLIPVESNFKHLQQLRNHGVEEFLRFRESVNSKITTWSKKLTLTAQDIDQQLTSQGVTAADFKQGMRGGYSYVVQAKMGVFKEPKARFEEFLNGSFYAQSKQQSIKDIIDIYAADLVSYFETYNKLYEQIVFYQNVLRKLTPLSLLNELLKEADKIKAEERIVPIYEFNFLLSSSVKDQPAPFIYERIGEKYRYFFIDEFQDTSTMQWENLSPLIANVLSQAETEQEKGSLMLVGDAKQSIYRWRGGNADQFLSLLGNDKLFSLDKRNDSLAHNWRSAINIVEFNNGFFKFYATHLASPLYKDLYTNYLEQKISSSSAGYVQVDFLTDSAGDNNNNDGPSLSELQVHAQIKQIVLDGYDYGDICVLTRTNKQGIAIAEYLASQGIELVSNQSLLVAYSDAVRLLVSLIDFLKHNDQRATKFEFIKNYLVHNSLLDNERLLIELLELSKPILLRKLFPDLAIEQIFDDQDLFTAVESLSKTLELSSADKRLHAFMELVHDYSVKQGASITGLLDLWEQKSEQLSLSSNPSSSAVTLMTIHKSKGLEFPIVIVPYCDTGISESRGITDWVDVDPDEHCGFSSLYVSVNDTIKNFSPQAAQLLEDHIEKTQLDHINGLYVAMTRPRKRLYLSTPWKPKNTLRTEKHSTLLWQYCESINMGKREMGNCISFSSVERDIKTDAFETEQDALVKNYNTGPAASSYSIAFKKGHLWVQNNEGTRSFGILLHQYISMIYKSRDLDVAIEKIKSDAFLTATIKDELIAAITNIVMSDRSAHLFESNHIIKNEPSLLLPDGGKLVPDRLEFCDNGVTIIDYKTGAESESHVLQVDAYSKVLIDMNYDIKSKILIYVNQSIRLKEWS
ncbi:MAG: UvrD-helicase domain-containing protein [Nonlabens sp.]